jgi:peptide/nickel transport system substrate-binding protein
MEMERQQLHNSLRVSSKWKGIVAVASAAVLVVGLAACSGGDKNADNSGSHAPRILKIGSAAGMNSLDPARIAVGADAFLFPVYEPLIRRDPKALLTPGLATKWKLSADATELDMTLRSGVKFQDGTPFDAAAVKANLDAAPSRGGQLAAQLSVITGVDVIDKQHVKITMSRPAADILGVLASGPGMMISPKALGSPDLGTKPVGTGPFKLVSATQTSINYKAWSGYWDKRRIKLDEIDFVRLDDDQTRLNAVLTNEIQIGMVMGYAQIDEQKARAPKTVVSEVGSRAYAIGLWVNTAEGQWANPAMRLAAQHAIDRKGISDALFKGGCEPVAQPFPTSFWASDPSLEKSADVKYDPKLAHQILEDAGLLGVKVKIYTGSAPTYANTGVAVQGQLNAVGMDVTVEPVDTATLNEVRGKGQFEASIATIEAGRPDPAQFVDSYFTENGVFNFGHQVYTGIEKPLAAMKSSVDQDVRATNMHKIMKQVIEQGPTVFGICSPTQVTMHSSKVAGVKVWLDNDNDYTGVYFKDDK